MHTKLYYWTRTTVRLALLWVLACIPYLLLPRVSGFYIFGSELAVMGLFIAIRFREPRVKSDTPIYDSMVRDYGDPLK
jgi:hypothetical protein